MSTKSKNDATSDLEAKAVREASDVQKMGMTEASKAREVMTNGLSNFGQEWMEFFTGRAQKFLDAQSRIASCGSVSDAVDLQREYIRTAVDEYSAQSSKMMERGSGFVVDDLKSIMQPETSFGPSSGQRSTNGKGNDQVAA